MPILRWIRKTATFVPLFQQSNDLIFSEVGGDDIAPLLPIGKWYFPPANER